MFSAKMQAIYKRLLILGLLSMCLFVFGYSDETQSVQATAPCYQDCEESYFMCNDSCRTSCTAESTREECTSCVVGCQNQFFRCNSHAISCDGEVPQPGRCTVNYGSHCPIIGGQANCADPSAYNDYFLICNSAGGGSCVSCPSARFCQGSGGQSACF